MVSRTSAGFVYACESDDEGETWSEPRATDLPGSGTPTSLGRVPGSDDLLLIWNQVGTQEWKWGFRRHRLTAAISSDNGRTWRHRRNLESLNKVSYVPPEEGGPVRMADRFELDRMREEKCVEFGMRKGGIVWAEYSSLIFVDNRAVITYDVVEHERPGCSLKLRVLPKKWFYEFE